WPAKSRSPPARSGPMSTGGELSGGNVPTLEWGRSSLSTATMLKSVTDALLDQQKDCFFIDLKKEALARVLILKRTEENKLDRMSRAQSRRPSKKVRGTVREHASKEATSEAAFT